MKNKILSVLSMLCLSAMLLISPVARATVHVIEVADFSFTPSDITNVMVGDTIQWVWVSGNHTTTSAIVPTGAATWDAPINNGGSNNSFTYIVTVAGDYSYICSFHSGSMLGNFTATSATSVPVINVRGKGLSIYPNPVKNDLNISFNYPSQQAGSVKIYDLTGKEVYQLPIEVHAGANTLAITLNELGTGMYVAEIYAGKEKVGVRRISKE